MNEINSVSHKRCLFKSWMISYLISYHIYLFYLISLSLFSYPELKKEGKKSYPAHIYQPLHDFLKKKYKSVNEGINQCIYEIYMKQPENLRREIESLKNQAFGKEKELKELEEAQAQKVISDSQKVISFLKGIVILQKQNDISYSFDVVFNERRLKTILNQVTSEMGYQGDISSLKNDIKKLWDMDIDELRQGDETGYEPFTA